MLVYVYIVSFEMLSRQEVKSGITGVSCVWEIVAFCLEPLLDESDNRALELSKIDCIEWERQRHTNILVFAHFPFSLYTSKSHQRKHMGMFLGDCIYILWITSLR
jgi:hypothetical protein